MATVNFTGNGQQKTLTELFCTPGLAAELHGQLTFISVLNSLLSVTAFLGNALILIALRKESSLHPPSKLLLRNLVTTDLCVGLISEPLSVAYWMTVANERWNICPRLQLASFIAGYILCGVSLSTLTAISVDKLLALLLGLRYRQVVTLGRTYVIVISTWVIAAVFPAMLFWNPLITFWYGTIAIPLYLLISTFLTQRFSSHSVNIKVKCRSMFNNRTKQIN